LLAGDSLGSETDIAFPSARFGSSSEFQFSTGQLLQRFLLEKHDHKSIFPNTKPSANVESLDLEVRSLAGLLVEDDPDALAGADERDLGRSIGKDRVPDRPVYFGLDFWALFDELRQGLLLHSGKEILLLLARHRTVGTAA